MQSSLSQSVLSWRKMYQSLQMWKAEARTIRCKSKRRVQWLARMLHSCLSFFCVLTKVCLQRCCHTVSYGGQQKSNANSLCVCRSFGNPQTNNSRKNHVWHLRSAFSRLFLLRAALFTTKNTSNKILLKVNYFYHKSYLLKDLSKV